MAAKIETIPRVFVYDNKEIPDPNPSMTPKEVREVLANRYPDIVNSEISGPEMKNDKLVYTFGRNLGTKG